MEILHEKQCIPCSGSIPPLELPEIMAYKKGISPDWELTHNNTRLRRKLLFEDFREPFHLAIQIGDLAEAQWHHPEIHLGWGHLEIEIWTHKINGLVESDFVFASKVDQLIK